MYLFIAHDINMNDNSKITRAIEIKEQFFDTEKEVYLYAMSRAYDMTKENELFSSLEFISDISRRFLQ